MELLRENLPLMKLSWSSTRSTILSEFGKHQFGDSFSQYERCYFNNQHDHIIITDTGEVKEFCDPRIQSIKKDIEKDEAPVVSNVLL